MKRAYIFANRNIKEIFRDPLSYIFCIIFPILMLIIFTVINKAIPEGAGINLFSIENLASGVAVFGLSFVMLFASLSVSKDRQGALLSRLLSSPMTAFDFVFGYVFSLFAIVVTQFIFIFFSANLIAILNNEEALSLIGIFFSCVTLLPISIFFIAIGIFFGTVLGEKSAPPCSSVIISLSSIAGGIWFDINILPEGGFFKTVCKILPFSHAVDSARAALSGEYGNIAVPFLITTAWATVISVITAVVFKHKMKTA